MVVHRDLKPPNILVTKEGLVKLRDFGIAKLVTVDAVEVASGALTRLGERALTPDYAAPEQLRGEAISAATDVYALGVLLYQLFSGNKPYASRDRSLVQLEREITRRGFVPPSETVARESASLNGRASTPRELRKLLRGDLDAIVAKSLRLAPEDRYADARVMRDDLDRHLQHEPVQARAGARAYVWRLFLRRNWKPILAAGSVLLVLLIGTVAVAWQAHLARIETAKALAVKRFLLDIFEQNSVQNPDVEKARNTTAKQLLDIGSNKIMVGLRDQPEVRDELLATVGDLYDQLELFDQATALTRARLQGLEQMGRAPSTELADAQVNLGRVLHMNGDPPEAEAVLRQSLGTMDQIKDFNSARRAHAMLELARLDYQTKPADYPETVDLLQKAVAMYDRCCLDDGDRGGSIQTLARVAERRGDYATAERGYRKALEIFSSARFAGQSALDIGRAYDDLGSFLLARHRYREAEQDLHAAGDILAKTEGAESRDASLSKGYWGQALVAVNRAAEGDAMVITALQSMERIDGLDKLNSTLPLRSAAIAIDLQRGALAAAKAHLEKNPVSLVHANQLDVATCSPRCTVSASLNARLLMAEGMFVEAAASLDLAEGGMHRLHIDKNELYARNQTLRAELDAIHGNRDEALGRLRSVIAAFPATPTGLPDPYVLAQLDIASITLDTNPGAAQAVAAALLDQILALPDHQYFADWEARTQGLLGVALTMSCNPAQAEPHLRRAVELRQMIDAPDSPWLAQSRIDLADALLDAGSRREATELLARAAEPQGRAPALADQYREQLHVTLDRLRTMKRTSNGIQGQIPNRQCQKRQNNADANHQRD